MAQKGGEIESHPLFLELFCEEDVGVSNLMLLDQVFLTLCDQASQNVAVYWNSCIFVRNCQVQEYCFSTVKPSKMEDEIFRSFISLIIAICLCFS